MAGPVSGLNIQERDDSRKKGRPCGAANVEEHREKFMCGYLSGRYLSGRYLLGRSLLHGECDGSCLADGSGGGRDSDGRCAGWSAGGNEGSICDRRIVSAEAANQESSGCYQENQYSKQAERVGGVAGGAASTEDEDRCEGKKQGIGDSCGGFAMKEVTQPACLLFGCQDGYGAERGGVGCDWEWRRRGAAGCVEGKATAGQSDAAAEVVGGCDADGGLDGVVRW